MTPKDQIPRMVEELVALIEPRREMPDREREELENRFRFHPATKVTGPKHDEVRNTLRAVALWVLDDIPPSRERSLALTSLQEAMMWCNAAIAIHMASETAGGDSA